MGQLAAIAVLGKIEVPLMSVIVESSVLRMKPDIYDLFIVEPMDQLFGDQKTLVARILAYAKKVQVGKDQEKAQSEKDSHSKNRGGKKPN